MAADETCQRRERGFRMTRTLWPSVGAKLAGAIAIMVLAAVAYGLMASTAAAQGPECRGVPATITGTSGSEQIVGTATRDVIVAFGGNDQIQGRGGNDLICANEGNDQVLGGGGRDRIFGGRGSDQLQGNSDNDRLFGQRGTDEIQGNSGDDLLSGGRGFDLGFGGRGVDTCRSVEFARSC
jgi:Ca2+-binding RTX toxin-like protein